MQMYSHRRSRRDRR